MRYVKIFICCFLFSAPAFAQPQAAVLLSSLSNARTDSQKAEAYKLVFKYYSTANLDSLNWYADQAIKYFTGNRNRLGEADIIGQLAILDDNQGRVELGKERTQSALEIYRELHNKKGEAEMNYNYGSIEAGKGNYEVAVKYFLDALRLYDTIADYHGLMMANMNLGSLYLQHQDTANAWKYMRIAETISKKTPLSEATIFLYNMIGVLNAETGQPDKAEQIFLSDLELSNNQEFVSSHVESLLYLGEFYMDKGETVDALQYLRQGLATSRSGGLQEMEANILVEIAMIREKDNADTALAYLDQARELCERIQSKSFLSNVYNAIATVYEYKGDYKDALDATRKKQAILDSMYTVNKAREIASLGAAYELEKSNSRISELESLRDKNAREIREIIAVIIGIFAILFILIIVYRRAVILNRRLAASEAQLRELNATKDKLFSIIGHDLRGPIARIPLILDVYEDPQTSAEERKFLMDNLREHTKASTETLDKLLFWGRSLLKGNMLRQEKITPSAYIETSIELKKFGATEKRITVHDLVPPGLHVYVAATHFDFIIRNLLDNAIKYSHPGGQIEISADTDIDPGFIVFAVKDQGIGIRIEDLPKIFRPLNSAEGTAHEKGTGIGLMLCKEFAIQNGGDMWVKSDEGRGATFYFSVKNAR